MKNKLFCMFWKHFENFGQNVPNCHFCLESGGLEAGGLEAWGLEAGV